MAQIITPKTVKIVKGEGMPIYNAEDEANLEGFKKGDLHIHFKIIFPKSLNIKQQEMMIDALSK